MVAMNINAETYTLSATSSSSSITLTPEDTRMCSIIVYNSGSVPVFIVSGTTSAPTAVFPTSATVPLQGSVIPPGAVVTLTKTTNHGFIAGITSSGTASVYIQTGTGE